MKHNKFQIRQQRGFTLVEIAIVLVIIGLLLGGVLKGQEMIENARIKSVVADMNGISAAYNSYVDRYRAIPGDETAATMGAAGRNWAGTIGGNGNGVLNTPATQIFSNAAVEQQPMWRALRASGLTSGDPAAPAGVTGMPRAGTGGLIGVGIGAYGLTGPTVCVSGLTTKQAAGIDSAIDGATVAPAFGNNTGNARGAPSATNPLQPTATAPTGVAFNEALATLWTMCRPL